MKGDGHKWFCKMVLLMRCSLIQMISIMNLYIYIYIYTHRQSINYVIQNQTCNFDLEQRRHCLFLHIKEVKLYMNAEPVLLQKKYCRVIGRYADTNHVLLEVALSVFCHSDTYTLMHEGISDMHCMSDGYLVEEFTLKR